MKFLHLGDLHIGKSLGDFDLLDDQKYILDEILKLAEDEKADAVLIAGDVYDKAIPGESAVRLFDWFLKELVRWHIEAFIISGNHDSDERLNFGSSLFETNGVFITGKFNGSLAKKTVQDEFGDVNIYMMPFIKASQVRKYYPDADIKSYDDAVRCVIEKADIDVSKRNIILAHQFVAGRGKDDVKLSGSEGLSVINVGTVEVVGAESFECFDYAALGHIHSGQRVRKDYIRYSGSPLKYSLSEINSEKSVPVITLKEKGDMTIEMASLTPKRDLRHLRGKLKDLLDKKNVSDTEDYIYATLTDEEFIGDAMSIIQQTYPNTVKMDYDNSRSRAVDRVDTAEITQGRSFEEICREFYEKMYGTRMTDEEVKLMLEAAGEAGVTNEAD